MNSQTARRPDQRSVRSAKTKKYAKQTAHVEARRDGQPLIFGWGGHLSRNEKVRIQRRAIWSVTILIAAIIIGVLVWSWIDIAVIIPNQPITSVNGQNIPQSDYHKMVVFKAQVELNHLKGPHGLEAQRSDLSTKIAEQQHIVDTTQKDIDKYKDELKTASDADKSGIQQKLDDATSKHDAAKKLVDDYTNQSNTLKNNDLANANALYTQSQIGNESATWLQEDLLIRDWLKKQDSSLRQLVEPTTQQIDGAMKDFKKEIPGTTDKNDTYTPFLQRYGVSDNDMRTMMAVKLRRDNLNSYLGSQYTSPARQVHISSITAATEKDAKEIINEVTGKSLEDFTKVAKEKSQDTSTKDKGGDLGWLVHGQYTVDYSGKLSGTVDNWVFDPARTVGEISPVLLENGSYRIIRINEIQESKDVDKAVLDKMKDGSTPLEVWVQSQRSLPGTKITPPDQVKLFDPANMPSDIPSAPPSSGDQSGATA